MNELNKTRTSETKDVFQYSFSKSRQEGATGETGSISVALVNNIASRRTSLPALFEQGSKQARLLAEMQAVDEAHLVDRRGKPTFLNVKDMKYIYALSHYLSLVKDEEEVRAYVQALTEGKVPKSRIVLPIDVTAFTKFVELDGKARARQKQATLLEFKRLSEMKQVQTFGKDDKQIRFVQPLISMQEQIIDATDGKVLDIDVVNVQLGLSFFYELYNRYAVIKPTLFKVWGKRGSGTDTELFGVLLSNLLAKYSGHRIAALRAVKEIKRSKYKTDESYFKARNKVQREALTYSELLSTLKQRTTTDYDSTREQKKNFTIDLKRALDAIKNEINLITDYSPKDLSKAERLDVVFNLDYDRHDRNYIAAAEPEPEEQQPDEPKATLFP